MGEGDLNKVENDFVGEVVTGNEWVGEGVREWVMGNEWVGEGVRENEWGEDG